jgi:hypothetical protein
MLSTKKQLHKSVKVCKKGEEASIGRGRGASALTPTLSRRQKRGNKGGARGDFACLGITLGSN